MGPREEWLTRALVKRRRELQVRQADLAAELHIHPMTLANWENGKVEVTPDKYKRWAAALGLHLEYAYQLTARARFP